uniref:fibronectin type III domain-containing protein n=1 Tax=Algoriphagus sp. TaxID=1872435 RepID=UPI0040486ED9
MDLRRNSNDKWKVYFTFFGLFVSFSSLAQESAHSAGGDGSSSIGSVAFSIGQVVYNSYTTVSGTESQGVQQRYDLDAVSNLKAVVDNQTIEVSWETPIDNVLEIVGYNLEISEDSLNYVLVSKTTELSYKIEKL